MQWHTRRMQVMHPGILLHTLAMLQHYNGNPKITGDNHQKCIFPRLVEESSFYLVYRKCLGWLGWWDHRCGWCRVVCGCQMYRCFITHRAILAFWFTLTYFLGQASSQVVPVLTSPGWESRYYVYFDSILFQYILLFASIILFSSTFIGNLRSFLCW